MSKYLITIAIPTYNNAKTIRHTIESSLGQNTDVEYEVLVVNNASQDETKKIIEQYDHEKLNVIHNDETLSMYENHNICLKHSQGKYVLFCHSDDQLAKHTIETLATKIKERNYPEKYVVWGHSMFRDFSSNVKNAGFSINEMIVGEFASLIFMGGGLTPSGTCYSRESFLELNGFLPVAHRLAPSDMTTMLFLALNEFRFEMIDEMIFIRTDASTLVTKININDVLDSLDDAFKELSVVIDSFQIEKLITISFNLKHKPYAFYYAIGRDIRYKKRISRLMIKELIKDPFSLRSKLVQKLMKRVFL